MRHIGSSYSVRSHLCRFLAVMAVLVASSLLSSPVVAAEPRVGGIKFIPELPQTGDELKVTMRLYSGGVRASIKWFLNDNELQESEIDRFTPSAQLNHPIRSGDKIKVEAIPFDEMGDKGKSVSRAVVCQNAPPHLKLARQDLQGETYVASVEAEDPEGGGVSFTLREAPEGMTIDDNGNIRWTMPKNTTGSFKIKIAAKDEEGGEAILSYTFTVRR